MLKLEDKWAWDFWFAKKNDKHHIFYLQAPKSLLLEQKRHHNATIGHAVSSDLIHWNLLPDALKPGYLGSWDDLATWTGSVIQHNNLWYMFYTGVNHAEKGLIQRIGLATSQDLITWKKHSNNPIIEADKRWYEMLDLESWHDHAWRDPYVILHNKKFYAFITARVNYGSTDGRGVIALAESNNLIDWEVKAPVTEPGEFGQLEVPQVVKRNNLFYLIFCTAVETTSQKRKDRRGTKLLTGSSCLVSDNLLGPYKYLNNEFLFGDSFGSLYSGKFLEGDGPINSMMAFHNYTSKGEFLGYISDPFKITLPKK